MNIVKAWMDKIEEEIKSSNKRLVMIAGASGGGKGHLADGLVKFLKSKGIRAIHIEADMYYKGISRIIVEKALLSDERFLNLMFLTDDIANAVRNVIKESPFGEKMCEENFSEVKRRVTAIVGEQYGEDLTEEIRTAFQNIDFDEPFAINFDLLNQDLDKLLNGQEVTIPSYSFATGELEFLDSGYIKPEWYDVFVVDGLYALRPELLENLCKDDVILNFLDCDLNSLLARRLHRDIKSGRTSFTPEQVIMQTLTQTMPAFYKHIEPTKEYADFIVDSKLTKEEELKRSKSNQVKYRVEKDRLFAFAMSPKVERIGSKPQVDKYFRGKGKDSEVTLRLRREGEEITELSFKMGSNTRDRHIEKYDLKQILSEDKRNPVFLKQALEACGFEEFLNFYKIRNTFLVPGYEGKFRVSVDVSAELGFLMEFEGATPADEAFYKKLLKLESVSTKSYKEMYEEMLRNPHSVNEKWECTIEDLVLMQGE